MHPRGNTIAPASPNTTGAGGGGGRAEEWMGAGIISK